MKQKVNLYNKSQYLTIQSLRIGFFFILTLKIKRFHKNKELTRELSTQYVNGKKQQI